MQLLGQVTYLLGTAQSEFKRVPIECSPESSITNLVSVLTNPMILNCSFLDINFLRCTTPNWSLKSYVISQYAINAALLQQCELLDLHGQGRDKREK